MQEINSLYLSNVKIRKPVFNDLNLKPNNMEKLTNKEIEKLVLLLQNNTEYWERKNNVIIKKLQSMRTNESPSLKVYFKWVASSIDGVFSDESVKIFENKKECYDDMRNAVLEKMKSNTQFDEDFDDLEKDDYIGYEVRFQQDKITHKSYSGTYTYAIKEVYICL